MGHLQAMTPKERWLASIRMQPVDRLAFWPKLDAAYLRAQAAPFREMGLNPLQEWVGSDNHVWVPGCVRERRQNTSTESVTQDGVRRTIYRTPRGETEMVSKFDVPSQSWHPVRHPVQSLDDIRLMAEFFSDVTVELDAGALKRTQAQVESLGQDVLVCTGIGKSPLMHWVEFLAGVEMAHYLLADFRGEVEALFEAYHGILLKKAEIIVEHSPVDAFYFIENTSTTLISPDQYRRYCARHIREYGEIVQGAGRLLILHMCGHLKDLLGDLAGLPARAFEAFTSPTLGDTTFLDGRTGCPDKCLIGGTNAVLWTKSAGEIISQIERDLDALPHHRGIVVTSAGIMPPLCKPETIKTVCDWVKTYPVRM